MCLIFAVPLSRNTTTGECGILHDHETIEKFKCLAKDNVVVMDRKMFDLVGRKKFPDSRSSIIFRSRVMEEVNGIHSPLCVEYPIKDILAIAVEKRVIVIGLEPTTYNEFTQNYEKSILMYVARLPAHHQEAPSFTNVGVTWERRSTNSSHAPHFEMWFSQIKIDSKGEST